MAGPLAKPYWKEVALIGAASGYGAQDRRCAAGPEALRAAGLVEQLGVLGVAARWRAMLKPVDLPDRYAVVAELAERVAGEVSAAIAEHALPVVVGGDHSLAIGTVAGAWRQRRPLGLLWIDAHLDSHTPETSPSQAIHGMPVAALLGYGPSSLVNVMEPGPKLIPEHVAMIAARRFEEGEADLLARLGVRRHFMAEVRRRGLPVVLKNALQRMAGLPGLVASIDLDACDPAIAPGVGSPAAGGLGREELLEALKPLRRHPRLVALEIAEYNPFRDHRHQTARLACDIIAAVVAPEPAIHRQVAWGVSVLT